MSAINFKAYKEKPELILYFFLFLFIAVIILRNAWVCDDAYISFRTVDNFANGYGLTWNTDERVQGFTNPLWVFLMSGFYFFTGDVYFTSIFVSLVLTLMAIGLVSMKVSKSVSGVLLVLMLIPLSKAFIDYSTSGLENPLSFLIVAVFYYKFLESDSDYKSFFTLSILASLGTLNRMDTILIYMPALLLAFFRLRTLKALLAGLAGFAPFILWEFFSIIYYGFPLPNTFYAKLHTGIQLTDRLSQGFMYYLDSVNVDPLTIIIIIGGIGLALFSRDRWSLACASGSVLYLFYIFWIGGDFMSGRFFSIPFLCSIMVIARYIALESWSGRSAAVVTIVLLILISPRSPLFSDKSYSLEKVGDPGVNEKGIADERAWYYQTTGLMTARRNVIMPTHVWVEQGRQMRSRGDSVTNLGTIGFTGFFAGPDVHIYDGLSLTDPLLARLPIDNSKDWRIGHFQRVYPDGYMRSFKAGDNRIVDSCLRSYYDKLLAITRGDIWDFGRWKVILKMNFGDYDSLLECYLYQNSKVLLADYIDVCHPKAEGTVWNNEGNFVLRGNGIHIQLDSVHYNEKYEISVDCNDDYEVIFYRAAEELARQGINRRSIPSGGLRVDSLDVPGKAGLNGYNCIMVIPNGGDDLYSIGHFRFLDSTQ